MIFKHLFNRNAKYVAAPMRGVEPLLTSREQDAMRASMEAQVTADRRRRGATDVRPGERSSPR